MRLCIPFPHKSSKIPRYHNPPQMRSVVSKLLHRSIRTTQSLPKHTRWIFQRSRLHQCSSPPVNKPPDHRTIATAQELLISSPYSPGSPLFLPHGTRIFDKLVEFLRAQYALYGYDEVLTPTIYKRSLWETSGHWGNYKEDMFEVSGRGASGAKDEGLQSGEEEEYGLKPMNCPGHCLMFKATQGGRGLKELPVRYADFSPLHRFHQDDAHIFCRPSQIAQEISSTLQFIDTVYKVFQLPPHKLVLSTRPSSNFIGSIEEWDLAEESLKRSLNASGQEWTLNEGDGAFYGPKIDIILKDSDGKQHQTATIQLDFQLPRRFGLEYLAPAPESEQKGIVPTDPKELGESGMVTPVIIHRAVLGSLERFMALLIEHYNGKWPFWLSPRQAIVVPVAMTDEIVAYARAAQRTILGLPMVGDTTSTTGPLPMGRRTFNVDIDETSNSLAKKVKAARNKKYNYLIVVGEKNVKVGTVNVDALFASSEPAAAEGRGEMTAEELYGLFLAMESKYA